MKRMVIFIVLACLLLQACAPAQTLAVQTADGYQFSLALPYNTVVFSETADFVMSVGTKGYEILAVVNGTLQQMNYATWVAEVFLWGTVGNGLQEMQEGPIRVSLPQDGVEYTANRTTGEITVRITDPAVAGRAAAQIELENERTGTVISDLSKMKLDPTPEKKERGPAKIVVADDDPDDLAEMGVAGQKAFETMGYSPVEVVSCLNDIECIVRAAMTGPTNGHATAVLLDGGFVGIEMPEGAPFPSVKARTIPGKKFASGPWIASYLRALGYANAVYFVSREGWTTIKQFRGQGAELGPTFTKENFFYSPETFTGTMLNYIK